MCFYRLAERIPDRRGYGLVRLAIKGVEHLFDMASVITSLHSWKPDIIHFQWLPLPPVDICALAVLRHIAPLVFTVHDTKPFQGSPSSWLQVLAWSRALARFDRLIVHSTHSARQLEGRGTSADQIAVVPHGLLGTITPQLDVDIGCTEKGRAADATKMILFFGAIKEYKGLDIAIRALAYVPEKTRRLMQLYVAGKPELPIEHFMHLARAIGVDRSIQWDIRFVPAPDVRRLLSKAYAVIFPYRAIDTSGALLTALPYGKPIVGTNLPGLAETIQQGVLVPPEDPVALGRAIQELVEHPDKANEMGRHVSDLAAHTPSWQAIARQTIDVYRMAIATRRTPRPLT
jgi:glycosyltransferase involved in cell wall biosynthesis